jgi:phosphatidylserine/phosphatidylglycerophosphate/cardiolipin synthase-like enzyme
MPASTEFDDDVAILGSANVDRPSLFLEYERALVVTSLTAVQLDSCARVSRID